MTERTDVRGGRKEGRKAGTLRKEGRKEMEGTKEPR
jgi:hypothetical protein